VYWRPELVKKLLSLQKIDPKTGHGYWVNANGRFWESDPVLVTAYSVIALQVALGR
jgi:squalene-hopene/tetraprenyl-beta-curcumene cyclase